ncbi:MAG: peptidylprolyl isomerase [Deltaproteobacteria bacterium]|nr:peptidylprolyl isomerase [Deltaproteobacteria bacterium]
MRTKLLGTILLLTLAASCEHKNKNSEPNAPTGSTGTAANTPPANTPPANTPPAEDPKNTASPGGDDVRPPVAADLAEYTKDLKGSGKMVATFETTMGAIHCELFPDKSPMTVANFVGLATGKKSWLNPKSGSVEKGKPYFDGLIFHRVIPEFMIQGGDPLGVGRGGPGYQFGDETNNGLKMAPGVLAMANAGPSTNGSQFFITEVQPDHLTGKHTIFGQCKELDLVKKIARVPQDAGNKPNTPIVMNRVTITKMQSW